MSVHWKTIPSFPDYEASEFGEIRNRRTGRILKPCTPDRYAQLTLYRNAEPSLVHVHRAVCEAFYGAPPTSKHHAAHTDGDRTRNRADNLRWATAKENEADKLSHGTSRLGKPSAVPVEKRPRGAAHGRSTKPEATARGERSGLSKLTVPEIVAIRRDTRPRKIVASAYGVTVTMIGYIQRGISWAHIPLDNRIAP